MLIPDIETFVKFIPTAGGYNPDPNRTDFDALLPFLKEAETMLMTELLGKDLFDHIVETKNEILTSAASTVVACNAYHSVIPFVDLVQTPNGFAVISNTNQQPASKERVERLISWIESRESEATDALISLVFQTPSYNAEWKKFGLYNYYTECLFMTASSLRRHCRKDAVRYTLEELHPVFMTYQNKMSGMISHEYMNELIEKRRNALLTIEDVAMIKSLMTVMGMMYRKEDNAAYELLETIINTMISNLDKYPAYADSQAYRIKMGDRYKNNKTDSTFFF